MFRADAADRLTLQEPHPPGSSCSCSCSCSPSSLPTLLRLVPLVPSQVTQLSCGALVETSFGCWHGKLPHGASQVSLSLSPAVVRLG